MDRDIHSLGDHYLYRYHCSKVEDASLSPEVVWLAITLQPQGLAAVEQSVHATVVCTQKDLG